MKQRRLTGKLWSTKRRLLSFASIALAAACGGSPSAPRTQVASSQAQGRFAARRAPAFLSPRLAALRFGEAWQVQTRPAGHTERVTSIAFAPGGQWYITGSRDGTLHRWDALTGKHLGAFRGTNGCISSAEITPDARLIVTRHRISCDTVKPIAVWDVPTQRLLRVIETGLQVTHALSLGPRGQTVIAHGLVTERISAERGVVTGERLYLLDLHSGKRIAARKLAGESTLLPIPGGRELTLVGDRGRIEVRDPTTLQRKRSLSANAGSLAQILPNGDWVQTVRRGDALYIYLGAATRPPHVVRLQTAAGLARLSVGPKGRFALVSYAIGGCDQYRYEGCPDRFVLQRVDLSSRPLDVKRLRAHRQGIEAVAFHPDGKTAVTGDEEGRIARWDLATGRLLSEVPLVRSITTLALSPDGRSLASGDHGGSVRVYSLASGRLARHDRVSPWPVSQIAYVAGGTRLLIADRTGSLALHDARTMRRLRRVRLPIQVRNSAPDLRFAIAPDGQQVAACAAKEVVHLLTTELASVRTFSRSGDEFHSVAFSRDGRRIYAGGTRTTGITAWDLRTQQVVLRIPKVRPMWVSELGVLSDERSIVAAGHFSEVQLLHPRTAPAGADLTDQPSGSTGTTFDHVRSLAISPDGRLVAASGGSGFVGPFLALVWAQREPGRLPRPHAHLRRHRSTIRALAFSRDGRFLATGTSSAGIRIWRVKN